MKLMEIIRKWIAIKVFNCPICRAYDITEKGTCMVESYRLFGRTYITKMVFLTGGDK